MAGNSPETPTVEQQADAIVKKLRNNESVAQPISPEVKAAAEKKIDELQEADRATIRAALDKLKQDAPKPSDGTTEVREALNEINPENLQKAVLISEKFINAIPSPEARTTLRGVHGAIIFGLLRDAGHNLAMQNGQIVIIPKPGVDVVNLQEKLQSLVNTGSLSLETIQMGMLYSSPAFKEYANMKKVKDASGNEIIDPKASSQDFVQYLQDLDKTGKKDPDIQTILQSKNMLAKVDMQKAIKGFQDMGQVGAWIEKNPQIMSAVGANAAALNSPSPKVPDEPNTTLTGKITKDGVTGGHVTGVVGDSTKGLVQGVGDILSLGKGDPIATLAIGGALVYGIYKAFQKFGFLGGLGTLFGLGAMNNIDKILSRFGVGSVGEAVDKAGKKAGEIADEVGKKIDGKKEEKPEEKPKEEKKPEESPSQQKASDKVRENNKFKELLNPNRLKDAKYKANLEDYLKYINQNLKDTSFAELVSPKDEKNGVFFDDNSLGISLPSNMDPIIFKSILRMYITGTYISSSTIPESTKIISEAKNKAGENSTLSQAIFNIQK